MYVSPRQKKRQIITAILLFLIVPVSVVGFLLFRDLRSRADVEEQPRYGKLSDLTETSIVISWITDGKKEGWIQWSDTAGISDGSPVAQDDRDVRSGSTDSWTTHYVTLSDLEPGTQYYFVIGSGGNTYKDANGAEFSFSTPEISDDSIPTPDPIFGTVVGGEDQNAIIYITLENSSGEKSFPVSALTNDSGNFEIDLAHIRTASLDESFTYDDDSLMYLFAQGGDLGGALDEKTVADRDDIELTLETGVTGDEVFADSSVLALGDSGTPCEADCSGKVCGDDGCGGSCGTCDDGEVCTADGACEEGEVCEPDCAGVDCGDDGCGGSCGTCDDGEVCTVNGACEENDEVCEPDCEGRECGDDGCGSTCGSCGSGETCNLDGECEEEDEPSGNDEPSDVQDVPLAQIILDGGGVLPETGIEEVLVTNVTENSFSVVWTSNTEETGSVFYGESADNLSGEARDTRDSILAQGEFYMHHVSITNLIPETTYFYELHSGSDVYDDNGSPYMITTPATQSSPPEFYAVFGEIIGSGSTDSVVIGQVIGTGGVSAYVSSEVADDGTWSLSIGGVRTEDYSSYFTYTDTDSLEITARTKGNEASDSYVMADIADDVVTIELDMIVDYGGGDAGIFERGIYADLEDSLDDLPLTAVNRLTALGLSVSALLIVCGSFLLYRVYSEEKGERWERNFLKRIDEE